MSRSSSGDGTIANGAPSGEPTLSGTLPVGTSDCRFDAAGGNLSGTGCPAFILCKLGGTEAAGALGAEFQFSDVTTPFVGEELNPIAPEARGQGSGLLAVFTELFKMFPPKCGGVELSGCSLTEPLVSGLFVKPRKRSQGFGPLTALVLECCCAAVNSISEE